MIIEIRNAQDDLQKIMKSPSFVADFEKKVLRVFDEETKVYEAVKFNNYYYEFGKVLKLYV